MKHPPIADIGIMKNCSRIGKKLRKQGIRKFNLSGDPGIGKTGKMSNENPAKEKTQSL